MAKSVKFYDDCDVYIRGNINQWNGYDENTTLEEMIDKANEHRCNVILKNDNGRWYLKGLCRDYDVSKENIEKNVGKFPSRKVWLVEF